MTRFLVQFIITLQHFHWNGKIYMYQTNQYVTSLLNVLEQSQKDIYHINYSPVGAGVGWTSATERKKDSQCTHSLKH